MGTVMFKPAVYANCVDWNFLLPSPYPSPHLHPALWDADSFTHILTIRPLKALLSCFATRLLTRNGVQQFVGVQVDVTSRTEGNASGVPLLVKYDTRLKETGKDNVDAVTEAVQVRALLCRASCVCCACCALLLRS